MAGGIIGTIGSAVSAPVRAVGGAVSGALKGAAKGGLIKTPMATAPNNRSQALQMAANRAAAGNAQLSRSGSLRSASVPTTGQKPMGNQSAMKSY